MDDRTRYGDVARNVDHSCAIHLDIQQRGPGVCPICECPLIPAQWFLVPSERHTVGEFILGFRCSMEPNIERNMTGNTTILEFSICVVRAGLKAVTSQLGKLRNMP